MDSLNEPARQPFGQWITSLNLDVVQDEYGYEEGEFTVFPEHWFPLWKEGLTPQQAFRRAIHPFSKERDNDG